MQCQICCPWMLYDSVNTFRPTCPEHHNSGGRQKVINDHNSVHNRMTDDQKNLKENNHTHPPKANGIRRNCGRLGRVMARISCIVSLSKCCNWFHRVLIICLSFAHSSVEYCPRWNDEEITLRRPNNWKPTRSVNKRRILSKKCSAALWKHYFSVSNLSLYIYENWL